MSEEKYAPLGTKPFIPLSECKHGHGYWLDSRNLCYGVFDENTKGFVGIRTKFTSRYLFTEYHWDTGAPFGTACPTSLDEKCPLDNLDEGNTTIFDWIQAKIENTEHDKQMKEMARRWDERRKMHEEKKDDTTS